MQYVRKVDDAALAAAAPNDRFSQWLLDGSSGGQHCSINWIRTPAGSGSPAGMHTHVVDQIFYVLAGIMSIEVAGQRHDCGPGSLIVFPAGVPHRNWNGGNEPTVHLAINAPLPDPNEPFARPV
jgi:mannose-6-phosphate isomerase-like protein (cupin superfamily)